MNKDKKEKKSLLQKDLSTKEVLVVLGVCSVIYAYGYLLIYPKYKDYRTAKNTLQSIETDITKYESEIGQLPIKKEKLDNLNREIKIKSRMLSHNMEDGMFLIGLSKVMDEVEVDLVDYSLEEVVPYETFYAIPTTISVRGDYRHIREVMYYLEEQKNMTQILDYSMETYIPESEEKKENNNINTIIPNTTVYWTENGATYHKDNCEVFQAEKNSNIGNVFSGSSSLSGKTACQVCKPYSTSTISNPTTSEDTDLPTKSKGVVEAKFSFIMYSSENKMFELENDNPSKWKPGKYNPFVTTTR